MAVAQINQPVCTMDLCGMVPIFLYVLSVCAHAWMLVEIDPSRDTCTAIAYETIAVLVLNILLLAGGAFHGCVSRRSDIAETLKPFTTIGLAALAAGVLVVGSRLTLFAYEAHHICGVTNVTSDDFLVDTDRRDRAGTAAWFGVVLLGVALLLQHVGVGCGDDDYDDKKYDEEREPFGRRTRRSFTAW